MSGWMADMQYLHVCLYYAHSTHFYFSCYFGTVNNTSEWKIKKGHIGIVEKAQETSSDSDMHNTVCLCYCCTS